MSVFKKLGLMLVALLAIAATALAVSATATAYPPGVDDTISASSSTVAGGQPITFSGTGRVPGETITVTLHSDPIVLGTTVVGPDGSWSLTTTIPPTATCGVHTVTATGSISGHRGDDPDADDSTQITLTPPCAQPSGAVAPSPPPSSVSVTGVAAMGIGALGVVLLVGGGVMLLLGRRRKASS